VTIEKRANARMFKGLPVVDSTEKHKFRVVENDGGTPYESEDCRAYRALLRAFPGATIAIFRGVTLIEMKPGTMTRFQNSAGLRKAIKTFDETGVFPAGDYVLNPVPATRTLDGRSKENKERGDARKGRVTQSTDSGLANGKPPVVSDDGRDTTSTRGRGRPVYDKVPVTA
jgi:hypothetical protein